MGSHRRPLNHVHALLGLMISLSFAAMAGSHSSLKAPQSTPFSRLANKISLPLQAPAPRTFVFFVNGDADHFVPTTSSSSQDSASSALKRVDSVEVARLMEIAQQARESNVVILHIQRGGDTLWRPARSWATWLRIYSRGQLLKESHVGILNAADPETLSELLRLSATQFPNSEIHLVLRGHGFPIQPVPKAAPFALSFPKSHFSADELVQGISSARIPRLSSITLAACSMAQLEVATRLAPYTRYLVATEVDALETLSMGFRFDSLTSLNANTPEEQTVTGIATQLFSFAKTNNPKEDGLMESPVTIAKLDQAENFSQRLNEFASQTLSLDPALSAQWPEIQAAAHLTKNISDRYAEALHDQGLSAPMIEKAQLQVRVPNRDPHRMDLGWFLDEVSRHTTNPQILEEAQSLRRQLSLWVEVTGGNSLVPKSGLSWTYKSPISRSR